MIRTIVVFVALVALGMPAAAETPAERGGYLVNALMGCDGCHTPRGPGGFDMTRRFSGGSILFDGPAFVVKGSNITQDRETGIGAWTTAEVLRSAFGDPDAVSVGDYHIPNTVAWALAGEVRGDDARMLALLEPFRGHRGRVCGLLDAGGLHAPRFGPRMPIRSFARW